MAGALGKAVKRMKKTPVQAAPMDRGAGAMTAPPKSPRRMTIDQLDDGTFHIQHDPSMSEPMATPKKFSARNAKHLTRHVRQTFGKKMTSDNDGDE
jgi:hypothetical protein